MRRDLRVFGNCAKTVLPLGFVIKRHHFFIFQFQRQNKILSAIANWFPNWQLKNKEAL
jgi:hypothetical protein